MAEQQQRTETELRGAARGQNAQIKTLLADLNRLPRDSQSANVESRRQTGLEQYRVVFQRRQELLARAGVGNTETRVLGPPTCRVGPSRSRGASGCSGSCSEESSAWPSPCSVSSWVTD